MKKAFGLLLIMVFAGMCLVQTAPAKDVIEFSISVETVPDHPRNHGLVLFIKNLEEKSKGRFKVKYYHSAQLYKGKDILKALTLGTIDMGVPGNWWLDKINPNAVLTALPMFYAQPPDVTEKLVDGEFGQMLNESIGKKMGVVVPGRWYELGYAHLHTTKKQISRITDLKGLKIRYFGSPSNAERLRALGTNPVPVPWPDMPMALMRGTVDGLITSFKSAEGAKLVEAGLKYSVADRQCMLHYAPMVSKKFWNSLPDDMRQLFVDVWNDHIPQQRALARKLQAEAELEMERLYKKKGGSIWRPSESTLKRWRAKVMPAQEKLIKDLKLDRALVDKAAAMLGMK